MRRWVRARDRCPRRPRRPRRRFGGAVRRTPGEPAPCGDRRARAQQRSRDLRAPPLPGQGLGTRVPRRGGGRGDDLWRAPSCVCCPRARGGAGHQRFDAAAAGHVVVRGRPDPLPGALLRDRVGRASHVQRRRGGVGGVDDPSASRRPSRRPGLAVRAGHPLAAHAARCR